MRSTIPLILATAGILSLAACKPKDDTATTAPGPAPEASMPAPDPVPPPPTMPAAGGSATAVLKPTQGNNVAGTLQFMTMDGKVHVTGSLTGLSPGPHGFHIHEKGDCSAPDGSSAGGHFNPDHTDHGQVGAGVHHAGDSNNITADAQGNATVDNMLSDNVDIGGGNDHDILGKAVIVHADADDYKTQPTGNAGGRLACGVIEATP